VVETISSDKSSLNRFNHIPPFFSLGCKTVCSTLKLVKHTELVRLITGGISV